MLLLSIFGFLGSDIAWSVGEVRMVGEVEIETLRWLTVGVRNEEENW